MDTNDDWRSLLNSSSIVIRCYLRPRAASRGTNHPTHKLPSRRERSTATSSVDSATRLPHPSTCPPIHPSSTPAGVEVTKGECKPGTTKKRRNPVEYAPRTHMPHGSSEDKELGMDWHQPSECKYIRRRSGGGTIEFKGRVNQ